MKERRKSRNRRNKFGGMKVCKVNEVRKYFINPKVENEVSGYSVSLVWISENFHASLVKIYCQK